MLTIEDWSTCLSGMTQTYEEEQRICNKVPSAESLILPVYLAQVLVADQLLTRSRSCTLWRLNLFRALTLEGLLLIIFCKHEW